MLNVDPAQWTFIGNAYFGWSDEGAEMWNDDMGGYQYMATHPLYAEAHGHKEWTNNGVREQPHCDHCGSKFHYGVVYANTNDGSYIIVGHICARKIFSFGSKEELALARLKEKVARQREKYRNAWKGICFLAKQEEGKKLVSFLRRRSSFSRSLRTQVFERGSLSEKQVAAAIRSENQIRENEALNGPEAPRVAAPSGRVEMVGEVLSVKKQHSEMYGISHKMLVEVEAQGGGYKVWVTAIADKGQKIRFKATLKASKDDASFAFGSRPHLVEVIG